MVVSRDSINASGMNAIVARVTATERLRAFPSVVTVEPERQTGLSMRSFILCHDLLTIDPDTLDPRPLGKILEVEDRLRYALDL
ncbi:MAG TPA: type II toxin-antitoxin system PemK/MazF family toxin [Gaiellaceae bacterium]